MANGLAGVTVEAYNVQAALVATAITNPDGDYALTGLGVGDFHVRTRNDRGLLDRLVGGQVCAGDCDPRDGDVVTVPVVDASVPGIDITLTSGAALAGTVLGVTESGNVPVANVRVQVILTSGLVAGNGFTDAEGAYVVDGLQPGDYIVRALPSTLDFVAVTGDGTPCLGCNPLETPTIAVSAGAVTNLDLTLPASTTLFARLRDDSGPLLYSTKTFPRKTYSVNVYKPDGTLVKQGIVPTTAPPSAPTDANGEPEYTLQVRGLLPGAYYLSTRNTANYQDEIYDDVPCFQPCNALDGTPVTVLEGSTQPVVEISLALSNAISGVVTEAGSDPVSPLAGLDVQLYTEEGQFIRSATTAADGSYAFSGLPNGDFRLRTAGNHDYVDQVYGGATCGPEVCDIAGGTPITLVNADVGGVDFSLAAGNVLTGYARDVNGTPISGFAELYSPSGELLERTGTSASSEGYFSFRGIADGSYFVYFDAVQTQFSERNCHQHQTYYHRVSLTSGHWHYETHCWTDYYYTTGIDTLAQGTACPNRSCDITTGTPVVVGAAPPALVRAEGAVATRNAVTVLEIVSPRGNNIRGSVTDYNGDPVGFALVYFLDQDGMPVGETLTDGNGVFVSDNGFPDGTYYAATSREAIGADSIVEAQDAEVGVGRGLQDEVWNGATCAGPCSAAELATATPIVISGADATGVDFVLQQAAAIEIEKRTNGVDADSPNAGDAPQLLPGAAVEWTYELTNTGGDDLQNIAVTDDQGVVVTCPATTLASGDSMTCTASGAAENLAAEPFDGVIGNCGGSPNSRLYQNTGSVTAETAGGTVVEDEDLSHYCNAVPLTDDIFADGFE